MKMTMARSDDDLTPIFVRPIFLKVIATVFTLGAMYATLTAQVADKVSLPVFTRHVTNEDSLKVEILHALDGVRLEVRSVKEQNEQFRRYICRQRPGDFGC